MGRGGCLYDETHPLPEENAEERPLFLDVPTAVVVNVVDDYVVVEMIDDISATHSLTHLLTHSFGKKQKQTPLL